MIFRPCFPIWLVLGAWMAMLLCSSAEAPSIRQDIAATSAWLESLDWPDLHGKPYLEFTPGTSEPKEKEDDPTKVRGFLLREDAEAFIILDDSGPLGETRVLQLFGVEADGPRTTKRPADLSKSAEKVIAELHQAKDNDAEFEAKSNYWMGQCRGAFFLARCCARLERGDLAAKIDSELAAFLVKHPLQENGKILPFRQAIESGLGDSLFSEALQEFTAADVTRAELLARFERVTRDFPASTNREEATHYATTLRAMLAEDEAHAKAAKPLAAMSAEEKLHEWIFQLRDQRGLHSSQSFAGRLLMINRRSSGASDLDGPARELVAMGTAAVPALIEALGDTRLSRSYQPLESLPGPWPALLTVGDCADTILSRIAGRNFWEAGMDSFSMQQAGALETARREAQKWWDNMQSKGEKAVLIQGVQAAGNDSWEQADRLIKLDPEAAVPALVAGAHAAKSPDFQAIMIDRIGTIKTASATKALRRELTNCRGLSGRVAAADALRLRGEKNVIGAMLREWNRWQPPDNDHAIAEFKEVEPLIHFLGHCGDITGMQALLRRFPAASTDTKFKIIASAAGLEPMDANEKLPPEIETLGEQLVGGALDDRTRRFGESRSQGYRMCHDPRVCDVAALALAERWPERYSFPWAITQFDRDLQIAKMRDAWQAAHGKEVPPSKPPVSPDANAYNIVLAKAMPSGRGLPKSIALSKPLTAEAIAETLHALGRQLPKDCVGFTFSAERPKDRRGILVEIAWRRGLRPRKDFQEDFSFDVLLGDKSLYEGAGGTAPEIHISDDMQKAMTTALADETGQPFAITYACQIVRTPKAPSF